MRTAQNRYRSTDVAADLVLLSGLGFGAWGLWQMAPAAMWTFVGGVLVMFAVALARK